jgi:hypothetical protein
MNLPDEKFVPKKPSKYDLLKLAVVELFDSTIQTYPCEPGDRERVHIETQDWEAFKEKVKAL